ncbi:extracellular calcium-sensing receptor [Xenopus laevis]|uniref:Extracellular calcium-sensing receptor n=1 Tax=Xenopus laevis TaxID=8355 RepID=A0A8J1KSN5_XENLA|nr:extracellular calcium-sensing receptor [Xenopus laevis]
MYRNHSLPDNPLAQLHKVITVRRTSSGEASMRRFLQVLLFLCSLGEENTAPACRLQSWDMESFSQPGDVLIGGVFVIHSGFQLQRPTFQEMPQPASCKDFQIRYYRDVLGLMFAIDEINASADLLPNITLGFRLFDSCNEQEGETSGPLGTITQGPHRQQQVHIEHMPNAAATSWIPPHTHKPSLPDPAPGWTPDRRGTLLPLLQWTSARYHKEPISHGSTLSALSNKMNFPSFLRTVPSNMFQNVALTRLIGLLGWTYVGMLVVDNDVGEQGGQIIQAGIEKSGSCVAFLEKIHLSYSMAQIQRVVNVIKRSSVNVIVLHSPEIHVKVLLDSLYDEGLTHKIFICSASFALRLGILSRKAWKVLNGTIGLIPNTGAMPGFEQFLSSLHPSRSNKYPLIRTLWEKAFSCRWSRGETQENQTNLTGLLALCTGEEDLRGLIPWLFEMNDLSYTYHAYLAVYAYAQALHSLLMCQAPTDNSPYRMCANVRDTQPWQVLNYVKKTHFSTNTGDPISFNADGDIPGVYYIVNVQTVNGSFNLVKVGKFDPEARNGNTVLLDIRSIMWNEGFTQVPPSMCSSSCHPGSWKATRRGQPICCYDCIPCSLGEITNTTDAAECFRCPTEQWSNEEQSMCIPKVIEFLSYQEPLGIFLTITVILFFLITLCILFIFIKYQRTPIIKATNRELSFILLVSLTLCFLCCLIFIGSPSPITCPLRQTLFIVVFSISISSVLAKTIMVILAFKATKVDSPLRKWLGAKIPRTVVALCTMIQVGICIVWLLLSPPFPQLNPEIERHKLIFECHEGQSLFFYVTLGFMGFLAMVSFFAAFLARNLPGSYNEAKLITFSMLVFCSVWVSFIPAHLSTKGKYTVSVQIFAILASSAGLLACIFVPKCYIILLRPDRNSRHQLTSRKVNRWLA